MVNINDVKAALNITGCYQDPTIQLYMDEVVGFLTEAGVKSADITTGLVARGVTDLWNYGGAEGKLSEYFMQRAAQLSLKNLGG